MHLRAGLGSVKRGKDQGRYQRRTLITNDHNRGALSEGLLGSPAVNYEQRFSNVKATGLTLFNNFVSFTSVTWVALLVCQPNLLFLPNALAW